MASVPEPNAIMITGPSAIFGRAFSTTIYGSKIFLVFSDHHSSTDIRHPTAVARIKPRTVS